MNDSLRQRPELLAPAGDWEALRAAVANGADAVYFGLPAFNARQRATNFALAELPDILTCLHEHNVQGYVALNTLIFSDELERAAEYARAIAEAGADAVIVQDLGLLRLIRRLAPTLPIHASTQMTQTEPHGIELLAALGVRRVILARELSLTEIAAIRRQTTLPLEVFVHGALCISYSGQCQASEVMWGRSANRGVCGQACRLPYQLIVDGQPFRRTERNYPLSPQDLAAYDRIPQLVALGIAGFKIEGRLKSAQYVAAATRVYRAALDAALENTPFALSHDRETDLVQSFSRGQCHGYLDGIDHQHLVAGDCPKKRGVYVADVISKTDRGLVVRLKGETPPPAPALRGRGSCPLKPGDGVVFDEGHPERDEQGGRLFAVAPIRARNAGAGQSLRLLTFGHGDINLAAVAMGAKVWKTDDPVVRRRLERSYARDVVPRRLCVHFCATARADEPLRVDVSDDDGHAVTVYGAQPLAAAEKHPLTVTLLRAQWGRLGSTPFTLGRVELSGPQGPADSVPLMAPKSALNNLRRQAVQALLLQRAAARRHCIADAAALATMRATLRCHAEDAAPRPELHVLVRTPAQFDAVLAWSPRVPGLACGIVYCDFCDAGDYEHAAQRARATGRPVGFATPRVSMPGEEAAVIRLAEWLPAAVLVRSLGALRLLRGRFPDVPLVADAALNVVSELAAWELLGHGVRRWTPAGELNEPRLSALLALLPASSAELLLYAHRPLFHTRYCLLAARLSAGPRCGACSRPCRSHALHLRDRQGVQYPVVRDALGRQTIFGPATGARVESTVGFSRLGVRHYRVELLGESPALVAGLLDSWVEVLV
jgi:putative protease